MAWLAFEFMLFDLFGSNAELSDMDCKLFIDN